MTSSLLIRHIQFDKHDLSYLRWYCEYNKITNSTGKILSDNQCIYSLTRDFIDSVIKPLYNEVISDEESKL